MKNDNSFDLQVYRKGALDPIADDMPFLDVKSQLCEHPPVECRFKTIQFLTAHLGFVSIWIIQESISFEIGSFFV